MPTLEALRLGAGRRWRAFARFCEPVTSLHGATPLLALARVRLGALRSKPQGCQRAAA
jgi:hypothetical protein